MHLFCTLKNKSACLFYNLGNIFLTAYFKHFVFMELSDFNSSLNNLFESSSTKDFFVDSSVYFLFDSLMCLTISFMALKTLKLYLSGLILINLQQSYFSNAFCLSISQPTSLSS